MVRHLLREIGNVR